MSKSRPKYSIRPNEPNVVSWRDHLLFLLKSTDSSKSEDRSTIRLSISSCFITDIKDAIVIDYVRRLKMKLKRRRQRSPPILPNFQFNSMISSTRQRKRRKVNPKSLRPSRAEQQNRNPQIQKTSTNSKRGEEIVNARVRTPPKHPEQSTEERMNRKVRKRAPKRSFVRVGVSSNRSVSGPTTRKKKKKKAERVTWKKKKHFTRARQTKKKSSIERKLCREFIDVRRRFLKIHDMKKVKRLLGGRPLKHVLNLLIDENFVNFALNTSPSENYYFRLLIFLDPKVHFYSDNSEYDYHTRENETYDDFFVRTSVEGLLHNLEDRILFRVSDSKTPCVHKGCKEKVVGVKENVFKLAMKKLSRSIKPDNEGEHEKKCRDHDGPDNKEMPCLTFIWSLQKKFFIPQFTDRNEISFLIERKSGVLQSVRFVLTYVKFQYLFEKREVQIMMRYDSYSYNGVDWDYS